MAIERTFGIIKPDAVGKNASGAILDAIQTAGFKVLSMRQTRLSRQQAEGFYAVHSERPFFADLIAFMTSGPVVLMALEAESAITKYRELMGPTDATKAPPETLRGRFGASIENNAVHGSDAPETAAFELSYFFPGHELDN